MSIINSAKLLQFSITTILVTPILSTLLLSTVVLGQSGGNSTNDAVNYAHQGMEWLKYLSTLDAMGLAEPAGSHGSMGVQVGAGAALLPSSEALAPGHEIVGDHVDPNKPQLASQLWLIKGMPLPIDFGISLGTLTDSKILTANLYIQRTLFEAFAMPAIAVRGHVGKTLGLDHADLSTYGGELVGSYGFLKFINVFASAGRRLHSATITPNYQKFLSDDYNKENLPQGSMGGSQTWYSTTANAGLQVMIVPPLVSLTFETTMMSEARRINTAKIAVTL